MPTREELIAAMQAALRNSPMVVENTERMDEEAGKNPPTPKTPQDVILTSLNPTPPVVPDPK